MNRAEARRRGLPPGYAIRLEADSGAVTYLSANGYDHTTEVPDEAMWFPLLEGASELAKSMSTVCRRWVVTTVPDSPWDGLDPYREAFETVFGPEDDGESDEGIESVRTEWGTIRLDFSNRN